MHILTDVSLLIKDYQQAKGYIPHLGDLSKQKG
jgi:hypothetical protein